MQDGQQCAVDKALRENQQALHTMIVLRHAIKSVTQREMSILANRGLTPAQFAVLDVLHAKGEMTVGDIIERALVTPGNMTVVIRNMERDGYIERIPNPNDGRSYLIALTERGQSVACSVLADHACNVGDIMSVLGDDEHKILCAILKKFKPLDER